MGAMRGLYTSGPPAGRKVSRVTLKRIAGTFTPYRREVAITALAVLASALLGLAPPFLLRVIINNGLLLRNMHVISMYTLLTIAATLGSTGFSLAYSYFANVVGQDIMRDLRNQLFDHLQGMSLRFFTATRTGEIQSRLSNDVSGVQGVLSDTAASILANLTTVISSLIGMIYLDWRLTLLSVGILPVFAFVSTFVGEKGRTIRGKTQSSLADVNATMQESLSVSGVLLAKVSGRRSFTMDKFRKENQDLTRLQIQQALIFRFFFILIRLTFSITPALVYWLAGYLSLHGYGAHLSLGTIVAFTALQSGLFFPLTNLLNVQVEVISALALFDRIFEYLDLKQEIVDAPNAAEIDPKDAEGTVEFEGVSFRYSDDQTSNALENITFSASRGQLIALVGHSGAGKTTLTYLIPRLYDVIEGTVRIDGIDVRQIKLESLALLVGIVTQETYLVHDTIGANLRYGRPDATQQELEAAAKSAAIHEFISSLPEGYETVVGERGYRLSGGEKQRIAIARAILKNPRILILDEATSALDTQSERLIQSALTPLMAGRTTFAIAHRLSTILAADLILVLQHGKIVERGTHSELMEQGGYYAELYAAQFQDPETVAALANEEAVLAKVSALM